MTNELPSWQKILVLGMNFIGDTLFTTPLLRALRAAFPGARIDVTGGQQGHPVLLHNPAVNTVFLYPKGKREQEDLLEELREEEYDVVFVATLSFESAYFAYRAGIPVRIGLRAEFRDLFLTHPLPRKRRRNIIMELLSLLRPFNIPHAGTRLEMCLTNEEEREADALLHAKGLDTRPFLVVHPGATHIRKRWGIKRFIDLINRAPREVGVAVVLIGAKDDVHANALIMGEAGENVALDLTNRISLRILAAVMTRAWAFVGGDSAPLHIASAFDVYSVAIFGGTDPRVYGTLHEKGVMLTARNHCGPLRRWWCGIRKRCSTYVCMERVTVRMVLDELAQLPTRGDERSQ